IQVSPKVRGEVRRLYVLEGLKVKKGELLAELEDTDYKADYDRAEAVLEAALQRLKELEAGNRPEEGARAKAELDETDATYCQLYSDWKRNVALKGGNVIAARDYEQAESAYRAMERRLEKFRLEYELMKLGPRDERKAAARAELRQAQQEKVKAKWYLDSCKVTAPVEGTILTKKTEEGNIVNPSAFSNGLSASRCEMADLTKLQIDLTIQEREIAKVFQDQKCRIRPDAYPERVYYGEVSQIMPIANRSNGTISVRVKVTVPREEEGVYLRPEMSALVSFLRK